MGSFVVLMSFDYRHLGDKKREKHYLIMTIVRYTKLTNNNG